MVLSSCHSSDAQNFEVYPRFFLKICRTCAELHRHGARGLGTNCTLPSETLSSRTNQHPLAWPVSIRCTNYTISATPGRVKNHKCKHKEKFTRHASCRHVAETSTTQHTATAHNINLLTPLSSAMTPTTLYDWDFRSPVHRNQCSTLSIALYMLFQRLWPSFQ